MDFQKALQLIDSSRRIVVTSHIRPDGDACGCMRALMEALRRLGKEVHAFLLSPPASWYAELFGEKVPVLGNDLKPEDLAAKPWSETELVIVVDTNSIIQLPGLEGWLAERSKKKVLVIDHHITGDGLGDVQLLDAEAAAAGELVFDLFKAAGWPIAASAAEAIFAAISSDTGWFRFGNADSRIFRTAAELIEAGARPDVLYRLMYQSFSPARLRLMVRMLEHLELYEQERIASQYILRSDFEQTGAKGPDTENLIDECQRLKTVEAAFLLVELSDGRFRCSLRSKGKVDVRVIAQKYGGGGHTLAAGVTLQGPLEKAKEQMIQEITAQLRMQ
ncbi:MAG TPA: bifunctional oligoribonuclease/PAP phosphatase NrnA [Anaerohalosphaeraceae bacterium]|nr:bifunctional oligoribonuclease/PAP phosphatase NrnA [Anaerohalosphaeraceae bacterium]